MHQKMMYLLRDGVAHNASRQQNHQHINLFKIFKILAQQHLAK
jgi:hypothetical protein